MPGEHSPSRRTFLGSALAVTAGLAGCTDSQGSTTSARDSTTATESTEASSSVTTVGAQTTPGQTAESTTPGQTAESTTAGQSTPTTTTQQAVTVDRDLTFRDTASRPLKLDLYRPTTDGPHPFLVWAHGGGWVGGDKRQRPMFPAMAEAGIAVADVQYRLAQERQYPAAVRDVAAAVKWLRDSASEYGIDADRGALGGYSAGAHLAALVGLAPGHESFQPTDLLPEVPVAVDAIVGYSGPYLFTEPGAGDNPLVAGFFGSDAAQETLREGSPAVHVDRNDPPAFLVHGTEDSVVPYRSTTELATRMRQAGLTADVVTGDGVGHGMINNPSWREETLPAQLEFLETHLRVGTA